MGLEKYVLNGNPMCCAANVVSGEHYRISMLTTALVRLEYSENGEFEDRPTQMVVNRDFAPTEFKVSDVNGELHTKDSEDYAIEGTPHERIVNLKVENHTGLQMPETGNHATLILIVLGLACMAVAIIRQMKKGNTKEKENEKNDKI